MLAGSSSWADRSLVRDGSFYPSRSLSAKQRLLHYASRLPLTEVATTYRFPPTPDVARRWVGSTPAGFTIDLRAWSLLCGAPTWPESLWPDLQGHVRPSRRDGTKLYRQHLPPDVVDECWDRFAHAVRPLAEAGRLGAVIVRFPAWFHPGPAAWGELAVLPARLPALRVAVEMTNRRWFEGDACEQTLGLLEELGLCFVCRDGPGPGKPIVAATSEVGFVRFTGSPGLEPEAGPQAGQEATGRGGAGVPAPGRSLGLGPQAGPRGMVVPVHPGRTRRLGAVHPGTGFLHVRSAPDHGQLLARQCGRQRLGPARSLGHPVAPDMELFYAKAEDGTRLACWDFGGNGRPVVMLHGAGLHGRCWAPVAKALGDGFRPLALDMRGHGASGRSPDGSYVWDRFASDTLTVIDQLGLSDATGLIGAGHSAGATALLLAEAGRPNSFSCLWGWEPIMAIPGSELTGRNSAALASRARRRRADFATIEEAHEYFDGRGPFAGFAPESLEAFLDGAFIVARTATSGWRATPRTRPVCTKTPSSTRRGKTSPRWAARPGCWAESEAPRSLRTTWYPSSRGCP